MARSKVFRIIFIVSGLSLFAIQGLSAEIGSTSVFNGQSLMSILREKASVSYYGLYSGGALGNIGNSLQPAVDGSLDPTKPQSVENFITTGYKISPDFILGVSWHFYYFMVGNPAGTGQDLQMLDPLVTLIQTNMINRNGFSVTGKLFAALPVSNADLLRPNNMITSVQPQISASYSVPNTLLSLGLFSYLRGYVHSSSTPDDARTYKLYVAPNVNYQLTNTIAATLWVDLFQITRNGGTGFFSGMQNDVVDLEPGFNWDITPNISVNPVLNVYPSNPTLAATSLRANLIAKAF